jgi:hypothetical protein
MRRGGYASRPDEAVSCGPATDRISAVHGGLPAVKHNPVVRAYYAKLAAGGKRKKVALVAVMHKVLTILTRSRSQASTGMSRCKRLDEPDGCSRNSVRPVTPAIPPTAASSRALKALAL